MNNRHLIKSVTPGSIAEEMEIEAGDYLLEVNGTTIVDIFDYQLLCMDEFIDVVIEKSNGEQWELEIEKDENEELGLEFENGLMDEYRSCCNKCMFCFIDQMPPGMRETLYFKDDDSRLSFLQGNYITLTNMNENDVDRIIRYNLSPINISVHTTNPKLRCKMLNNRFAGDKLKYIDRLNAADVEMNGQVVLCKNVNDKEELERTISDLEKYIPNMRSVSIVPSGLTKFRDGLYPLELFEKEDACAVWNLAKWNRAIILKYRNEGANEEQRNEMMQQFKTNFKELCGYTQFKLKTRIYFQVFMAMPMMLSNLSDALRNLKRDGKIRIYNKAQEDE